MPRSIAWWNRGTYPTLDPQSENYQPDRIEPGWRLVLIPGAVVDEASPPTPSPGLPTATPAATAAGSVSPSKPPAGAPAVVVSAGPRGTNRIALTFDMGGRLDPAMDIVTWLVDHKVHATFFPTGKSATTTTEGRAAMTLAAAHPELFDFGNHSWDHPDFTSLSAALMSEQLTSTDSAVTAAFGQSTKPWFRPPYGAWNESVRTGVGAAGWPYLVMWDIDTIDWKSPSDGGPTSSDIVTRVLSKAQGGSIVLMHLGGWHTLEALPDILTGLQGKGLQPVTLTEMLGG
jgi:peptidoglycan/xylan/chitin deacetylase (PgdA/CDA1 family)